MSVLCGIIVTICAVGLGRRGGVVTRSHGCREARHGLDLDEVGVESGKLGWIGLHESIRNSTAGCTEMVA